MYAEQIVKIVVHFMSFKYSYKFMQLLSDFTVLFVAVRTYGIHIILWILIFIFMVIVKVFLVFI